MSCSDFIKSTLNLWKGTLVLIGVTICRIIMFMVYLSASIGPSVLISRVYDYCTGLDPVPDVVESAICMLFVSCWAEFSLTADKRICGDVLEKYKNDYPNAMSFGRFTVNFLMYALAYCHLFIQFQDSHCIPSPVNPRFYKRNQFQNNDNSSGLLEHSQLRQYSGSQIETRGEDEVIAAQSTHTAYFLLAFAYLVFITSKNLYMDVLHVVRDIPYPSFSAFNSCMIRIGFALIHLAVNALYFLPCLAMAYSIRAQRYAGNLTYFQLTFVAALSGMISSLFELYRPWPQRRGQMPFLYLENNMIGKHILLHVLIVFILIAFYRPFNHGKIPERRFDASCSDVMYFCLSVAFTILHITKYGTHAVLSMVNEADETPRLQIPEDIPIEAFMSVEAINEENRALSGRNQEESSGSSCNCNGNGLPDLNDNKRNNNNSICTIQQPSSEPIGELAAALEQGEILKADDGSVLVTSKDEFLKALKRLEIAVQHTYPDSQPDQECNMTVLESVSISNRNNSDDKTVISIMNGDVIQTNISMDDTERTNVNNSPTDIAIDITTSGVS